MAEQTQYNLTQQLLELIQLANREGLYDAADHIRRQVEQSFERLEERDLL